ncbi:hypothetical protein Golomagni_06386, partial [Golovinomyces magnicellulatus]
MAQCHMEMKFPPPFRSKFNKFTTDVDYSMTSPLSASGSDFPCKGYHKLYDTPQGASVATFQPGGSYTFSLVGSATHNGGSCQVSMSYDKGNTWKTIHSYIGNCPLKSDWNFTFPNDTPSGDAIFAWSWFNNIGNREMYMNCAHVTIGNKVARDTAAIEDRSPADPYNSRPAMFVANVGGDTCTTIEMTDLDFPNSGPDVDRNTQVPKGPSCPNGGSGGANPPGGSDSGSS